MIYLDCASRLSFYDLDDDRFEKDEDGDFDFKRREKRHIFIGLPCYRHSISSYVVFFV